MSKSSKKYWAIVPAAGSGNRFSSDMPKQFHQLDGQQVAQHTLSRLLSLTPLEAIYIPCDIDCPWWSEIPAVRDSRVHLISGGEQRANSVLNGLNALQELASDDDWVLVHDMVRPCVTTDNIRVLMDALIDHPVGGILAAPVNDTLKIVSAESEIHSTVDRDQYRVAQTPQMFRYNRLKQAISAMLKDQLIPTDEAAAIEYTGQQALAVNGRQDNIKITRREDLVIASAIMKNQRIEKCV
jgi:2-C-methyl-D-erythritol 4-phosphate cytidylyltransferase